MLPEIAMKASRIGHQAPDSAGPEGNPRYPAPPAEQKRPASRNTRDSRNSRISQKPKISHFSRISRFFRFNNLPAAVLRQTRAFGLNSSPKSSDGRLTCSALLGITGPVKAPARVYTKSLCESSFVGRCCPSLRCWRCSRSNSRRAHHQPRPAQNRQRFPSPSSKPPRIQSRQTSQPPLLRILPPKHSPPGARSS